MTLPRDDRLLPWWLERQLDPTGPDVVPGPAATDNTTHRNWIQLGTVGAPERAVLDPRGLLTPRSQGWSIDWWAGADDRWHLPSRSTSVRQRLIDDAPVIETALRIPSGDLLHRAWAVAAVEGADVGPAVVVELENASPVPVAVALAVRPWNVLGPARVDSIDLDDTTVSVDGLVAMMLPKRPSRVAVGDARDDSVGVVLSGAAADEWPTGGVRCRVGAANAAFLFPLPHTAVVRFVVPLLAVPVVGSSRRRAAGDPLSRMDIGALPDATRVASGWEAQVRRAPRIELPERRLDEALAAARRHLLLHSAGDDAGSWPTKLVGGLDTARLAVALDRQGLHTEAARLVVGYADRQNLDGSFARESRRADAAGGWMWAVGEHVRLTGVADVAVELVGPLAKAAHHVHRRHLSRRARRTDGRPALLPAGAGPSWLGDDVSTYHDALWSWRGLVGAAVALDAADQPDAATEVRGFADDLARALAEHVAAVVTRLGAGPDDDGGRAGVVATVVALAATLVDADPRPMGAADALDVALAALAADPGDSPAVWHDRGHAGYSPRLTAGVGLAQVVAGNPQAVTRLRWLLDAGAPLWSWPEFVHPRTGGGSGGQGHDGSATVAFLDLVRALAVVETPDGLDLLGAVPSEWYGQPIEVHGVPTACGTLSYAVRWHGERPALLWELEPHPTPAGGRALPDRGVTLRAPGLDPDWRTTELRGEALLDVPPLAPAVGAPASAAPEPPLGEVGPQPGPQAAAPSPPTPPDEGISFS